MGQLYPLFNYNLWPHRDFTRSVLSLLLLKICPFSCVKPSPLYSHIYGEERSMTQESCVKGMREETGKAGLEKEGSTNSLRSL